MSVIWILELANEGARNLLRHKLRSLLSLLGIVIGVGAVIAMMAVGEGAQRKVLKDIGGLGLHNIILDSEEPSVANISPASDNSRQGAFQYGLIPRDVDQFRALLPSATVLVGHLVKQKIFYRSTRVDAPVLGVDPAYFKAFPVEILAGHLLAEVNNRDRHPVAVVTEEVARTIPAVGGVLGQIIQIGGNYFRVIGVIRMPSSKAGMVFLPYRTARNLFGILTIKDEAGKEEYTKNEIGRIVIHLEDDGVGIPEAAAVVDRILKKNHPMHDYEMTVPLAQLQVAQQTRKTFDLVLIVIAAISLVIGGIGIMNIMLAIVTERIPEIGIRRALGASQRDILLQFLSETVVLSTSGGILGCVLGVLAVPILSRLTEWPGVFTPSAIIVALVFSWLVGVIFGIAPAMQAAKMHPVDCLRYE
ncbi:MAG: ABC transporter permease [Verrucomicrobia bacterium]|nr:ABC transporter permease [Verrucomicrobiota bacterium]MCG2680443.1 ABC transporter permease [Kiritimatiellia bacterium]MBU4247558.1 ABC transporter permease [Verrucomicrobiota bacterium]MBU4291254.1 ABC transporter permease [Verrucomicrobiota bacterium]MBU4428994.1 ABC transporter permease [Verrucomicrobiota bacterium]